MDNRKIKFRRLGTMVDCSRNAVMNVKTVKEWIDITSSMGYNTLMLYTEDTYEVNENPYFGYLRGRYSKAELKEIDAYAKKEGMELIPCIQTLAHLNAITRWGDYAPIIDTEDILLAGDDRVYKLIDNMFATISECFTSKTVNIGMDEAHMLGRGKYQDINGFKDRFDILLNHLNKVSETAEKYGLNCIMWGDMFFRLSGSGYNEHDDTDVPEKVKKMIPHNVDLVYWDYYSTEKSNYLNRIKHHSAVKDNIWFAGGAWSWTGFAPHNGFSINATTAAFDACLESGVENVFLTLWGDDGAECSKYTLLPSLYYASELAKGQRDFDTIKEGFRQKFGIPFDAFMLTDLKGTPNDVENRIVNSEKYMLYNDCFMGVLDSTVRENDGESYAACSEKLKEYENHEKYGYIFKNLRTLCDVLAIKYDLGVRTRKAYDEKNTAALKDIVSKYDGLLNALDIFYNAFNTQWHTENKPQGFEVQDMRIGGLYRRIKNCKEKLEAYLSGKISTVEELDERLLNPYGNEPISFNSWKLSSSTAVISHF